MTALLPCPDIVEPRWTRPALVAPGGAFEIVVRGMMGEAVAVYWRLGDRRVALEVDASEGMGADGVAMRRMFCRAPLRGGEGLGGLEMDAAPGAPPVVSPGSLCVCALRAGDPFVFVHTSDLHLLWPNDGALFDRRPTAEALVRTINEAAPALVLNTGDVISRYDGAKEKLPDAAIRWQAVETRRILTGMRAPQFVIAGNHDVAFPASREAWHGSMGGPAEMRPDDCLFDFAGCRFVGIDGFHYTDAATMRSEDPARRPGQLDLLGRALRDAAGRPRFVFTHYDYRGDIVPVLEREGCELFLYGHSSRLEPASGRWAVSHLPHALALRVWRVADGEARCIRTVRYDELTPDPPARIDFAAPPWQAAGG